jgi:hypothetical protein
MSTVVIMPGGFHPFHAGHAALYNSIRRAFPDAKVFVAATNDTSARPFPFAVKEKLAKLAGVEPGHFVQVKSPFRAEEITSQFNPEEDQLIFVRSEKDADKPPQAGGVKKNGEPAYLQPLLNAKKLEPFARHAYMAYLPTVEFGPGMTSATEIRTAWPQLNDKRKQALVMSLYPATQKNPALAANVIKMLDTAIGSELEESTGDRPHDPAPGREFVFNKYLVKITPTAIEIYHGGDLVLSKPGDFSNPTRQDMYNARRYTSDLFKKQLKKTELARIAGKAVDENQGWAATLENHHHRTELTPQFQQLKQRLKHPHGGTSISEESGQMAGTPANTGMWAGYQQRENQPVDEDYVEEKWSQKYKKSINCANPRGFSQRAHCAGRKK